MVVLEEIPMKVYGLALDADKCIYHPLCLSQHPELEKPRVFYANLPVFRRVIAKIQEENFNILKIIPFSNRQSFPLDYAMSHKNYPTPYFFISLYEIKSEFEKHLPGVRVEVMALLLSDIDQDLETGTSMWRGWQVYSMLGKKVENAQSLCAPEYHPRVNRIDGTKFNIFYPQVHALGDEFKSERGHFVLYHVVDDNKSILKNLISVLKTKEGLQTVPSQMKILITNFYDVDRYDILFECVGTGSVDRHYRLSTKALLGEIRRMQYEAWEQTPVSNRTPNFMLLPDPDLPRDLLLWRRENASKLDSTPFVFKTFPPLPSLASLSSQFTPTPQTKVHDSTTKFSP